MTKRKLTIINRYWDNMCVYCLYKKQGIFHEHYNKNGITLDHFIPRAIGGSKGVFNMVPSCNECNLLLEDYTPRYLV